MKLKLLLFLLFIANLNGFSQEIIKLLPNKDVETVITLRPVLNTGVGEALNVPVLLNWDKESKIIKVQFRGDRIVSGKFIYAFPRLMFYKDVAKEKRDVWFDKGMKNKYMTDRTVAKSINLESFAYVRLEGTNDKIMTLVSGDADSKWIFNFRESVLKENDICKIPMTLYVASRQPKKAKSEKIRKMEYQAKFTLNISLIDICYASVVANIITQLNTEIEKFQKQQENATNYIEKVTNLPCNRIIELNNLPRGEEREYENIKDKQYADCDNLKEAILIYNEALAARNNAINNYNTKLDKRKQECREEAIRLAAEEEEGRRKKEQVEITCSVLDRANKTLMSLGYRIKSSKQKDLPAFRQEFERIKGQIDDTKLNTCNAYEAYRTHCAEIEKLLKK